MIDDGASFRPPACRPISVAVGPTPALWMSRAVIVFGWALILSGLVVFGGNCLAWLRDESWRQPSLADLWGHLPLGGDRASAGWEDMRGLHHLLFHVLHWFGRFPISLVLVVVGLAAAWTGNGAHDRAEQDLARRARRFSAR